MGAWNHKSFHSFICHIAVDNEYVGTLSMDYYLAPLLVLLFCTPNDPLLVCFLPAL